MKPVIFICIVFAVSAGCLAQVSTEEAQARLAARMAARAAATTQTTTQPTEIERLTAENEKLRGLVDSLRSQLAEDEKRIVQMKKASAISANQQAGDKDTSKHAADAILLNASGSGSKTTDKFTAAGDWDLIWSYDCRAAMAPIGGKGNFQIFVYNGDGTIPLQNTLVRACKEII